MEPDDVDLAHSLGFGLIGARHPDTETMRRRLAPYPGGLSVARSGGRCAAYSLLYLLTEEACRLMLAGSLVNAAALTDEHIATPATGVGLYCSVVAGAPDNSQLALRLATAHATRVLCAAPGVTRMFARAATPQGDRLLGKLGFVPIAPPSEVRTRATPRVSGPTDWPLATRSQVVDMVRAMQPVGDTGI